MEEDEAELMAQPAAKKDESKKQKGGNGKHDPAK